MQISELYRPITDEIVSAQREIERIREEDRKTPAVLRRLVGQRTDSFVDLARHYLPNLSHQTLADTWDEVRGQIRDLLLLKDDECRRVRSRLLVASKQRGKLEMELELTRQRFDRARLDLLSKTGNFKKTLRQDAQVLACNEAIAKVDREIEQCIGHFEALQDDAKRKLPDYEACSLFSYLRDRQFGTPQYSAQGLERRWDRWVAKLIDYRNARASFDFLIDTPVQLQKLIDQKRDRYKELLEQLEGARDRALTQFGVQAQKELWKRLGDELQRLDNSVDAVRCRESQLKDELHTAQDINGNYYQKAIQTFRRFLEDQKSDVLSIYAACTESPVDDEICARLRRIDNDIANAETESKRRGSEIIDKQNYVAALRELSEHWRDELRSVAAEFRLPDDAWFQELFCGLRSQRWTPSEAWRKLRSSIEFAASDEEKSESASEASVVQASFLAALQDASQSEPDGMDLTGVLLCPSPAENAKGGPRKHEFTVFARCASETDAAGVTSLLMLRDIRCFAHRNSLGTSPVLMHELDEVQVMIELDRFNEGRELIRQHQRMTEESWTCSECESRVDNGFNRCWRCGVKRRSR